MKIQHVITRYWLAMNASAFDAAVTSSSVYFGLAGVHAAVDTLPALNLQQFGYAFLFMFARGILAYLSSHPLVALVDEVDKENTVPAVVPAVQAPIIVAPAQVIPLTAQPPPTQGHAAQL